MTKAHDDAAFHAMYQKALDDGKQRNVQCCVTLALRELPAERAAKMQELMVADVAGWRVANLFVSLGYAVSTQSVNRHRRRRQGGCQCPAA